MNWAWSQACESPGQKLVLMAIADHADGRGVCWPGEDLLAEKCSMSERSVRTHVVRLAALGLLSIDRRRAADGTRQKNLFSLCIEPPENISGGDPLQAASANDFAASTSEKSDHRKIFPVDDGHYRKEPPENISGEPKEEPKSKSKSKSKENNYHTTAHAHTREADEHGATGIDPLRAALSEGGHWPLPVLLSPRVTVLLAGWVHDGVSPEHVRLAVRSTEARFSESAQPMPHPSYLDGPVRDFARAGLAPITPRSTSSPQEGSNRARARDYNAEATPRGHVDFVD